MEPTLLFYATGWISLGILLATFAVDGILDFLEFDFFDGSIGPTAIFGFLSVFGLVGGALASNTEWSLEACLGVAFGAGIVFGFFVTKLLSFFRNGNSGEVSEADMVGNRGTVVLSIPANGYGKVRVNNSGHLMELAAKSAPSSGVILSGTTVVVTEILGPGSVRVSMPEPASEKA